MHLKEGHNLICTKVWNFIGATKYTHGPVFYYLCLKYTGVVGILVK